MAPATQASWPRFTESEVLWEPSGRTDVPRRAQRPVRVRAYVPAPIAELSLPLPDRLAQVIVDAELAVGDTQRHADTIGVGTVAQQLLRSEAIASSQIEGVPVPGHRALAAAVAGGQPRGGAKAAIANIEAVRWVYGWASSTADPFTSTVIRRIHARLADADRYLAGHAGRIRETQNWIGRDPYTPAGADFIPPPASDVQRLLDDLCTYANRRDVPAVLQAAVVHAQFETIHPFGDGNGRVGRSLIGAVLARRGLCRDVIPPISLVLSRSRDAYIDGLTSWRYDLDGAQRWIELLAHAVEEAAIGADRLAGQVADLQERWLEQAGRPRRDSAAAAIVGLLPAHPVLNAAQASALVGRTPTAARAALNALEEAGVLRQVTIGRRNRMWECVGLFALVDEMERTLSDGQRGAAATR